MNWVSVWEHLTRGTGEDAFERAVVVNTPAVERSLADPAAVARSDDSDARTTASLQVRAWYAGQLARLVHLREGAIQTELRAEECDLTTKSELQLVWEGKAALVAVAMMGFGAARVLGVEKWDMREKVTFGSVVGGAGLSAAVHTGQGLRGADLRRVRRESIESEARVRQASLDAQAEQAFGAVMSGRTGALPKTSWGPAWRPAPSSR